LHNSLGGGNAPQGWMEVVLVPLLENEPPLAPDPALNLQGRRLVLSVQTFKKCPFYAGLFATEKTPPIKSSTLRKPMARTGRSPGHMARVRARRRPFSDPRAGRLLSSIEFAFFLSRGEPISTTGLVKSCYPAAYILGELKSWHGSNVVRAVRRVAVLIGRGTTKGRTILWRPVPRQHSKL
jgi:hypothetical protein